MEKNILCFGDSNTFGSDPRGVARHDRHTRWPGVLRDTLGTGHWIIEEGSGGRTTVHEDPIESHASGSKNGAAYLPACLNSHKPLDLVVILLGTNDLKPRFAVQADDIARGAGVLVDIVTSSTAGPQGGAPQVLLIAPPPTTSLEGLDFAGMFAGAEEKSQRLAGFYAAIAKDKGVGFLDAGALIESSPVDGIHWEPAAHATLGRAVAQRVGAMLGAV